VPNFYQKRLSAKPGPPIKRAQKMSVVRNYEPCTGAELASAPILERKPVQKPVQESVQEPVQKPTDAELEEEYALCPGYDRVMTSLDDVEGAVPPSTPTAPTTPSTPSAPTKPEFTQEELDDWCAPVEWTPAQLAEQAALREAFRAALCPGYVRDMTPLDDVAVTQLYNSYPPHPDHDARLSGLSSERAGVL
jgi:hypothetical protein